MGEAISLRDQIISEISESFRRGEAFGPPSRGGAEEEDRSKKEDTKTGGVCLGRSTLGANPGAWETQVSIRDVRQPGETLADMLASAYEIEIAGVRFAAKASLAPMYDPKSERVRG